MNNKVIEKDGEVVIDLQRVFAELLHRAWLIVLVATLCAVIVFTGTFFLITPQYQSSAMFYVNNSSLSVGDASFSISSGDITAAKDLVESYIVILKSRTSLNEVIQYAEIDRTYSELSKMISAASVNETEIFEVIVTSSDPVEAEKIASAIAYVLPQRISNIIEGTSAKVVDSAVIASSPSSPSYTQNTVVGFLVGFILTVGIIALRVIFDTTIRTEEDINQVCSHPVLAAVPDMASPSKGGYYYGYGNKKKKSSMLGRTNSRPVLIGKGINFAASESYKLLRTKLQFSFTDEKNSRVIGVSSALSGEGKSLTAVNLAYTLFQLDKRVILIDCDMRRPTLAEKLCIKKYPGLSGLLTGQNKLRDVMQGYSFEENKMISVITAGQNPPNPVELLSSKRMVHFLEQLREYYDYIILDLPPVNEVSDALAVAKVADGMLLVVRQNYCDRTVLENAVKQFEFIEAKILGVVYNGTIEDGRGYGKGYYKKYGKKYYYKNEYGYGRFAESDVQMEKDNGDVNSNDY